MAGPSHRPEGQEGLGDALRRGCSRVLGAAARVRMHRGIVRHRRRTRVLRGVSRPGRGSDRFPAAEEGRVRVSRVRGRLDGSRGADRGLRRPGGAARMRDRRSTLRAGRLVRARRVRRIGGVVATATHAGESLSADARVRAGRLHEARGHRRPDQRRGAGRRGVAFGRVLISSFRRLAAGIRSIAYRTVVRAVAGPF